MTFELIAEGVTVQTVAEIMAEIETAARADIHPQCDVSATSPLGQQFGIWAEREAQIQQAIRDVSNGFSPRASGAALANVSLLTGVLKRGKTYSIVSATVTLTAGTPLPVGSRANVDGDSNAVFETTEDVVNLSGITADFAVSMRAVDPGPVRAVAGALTVINTPVAGWLAITNAFDADVGKDIETDPELRLRREQDLRVQGSTVILAIATDVLVVVQAAVAFGQVRGFENTTDATNVDGLTPHSFEIVVWDGTVPQASDSAIAQAILDASPAGIQSVQSGHGTAESGLAVNREGATHVVLFSRALQKTLYIDYVLVTDDSYPVDGDAQVKSAAVAVLDAALDVGEDVILTKLYAPAYSVQGVLDVVSVEIGFTGSTSAANLTVGSREIAIADTSRVTVVS
jgi:uncharacterized phage protein gp47/JayE